MQTKHLNNRQTVIPVLLTLLVIFLHTATALAAPKGKDGKNGKSAKSADIAAEASNSTTEEFILPDHPTHIPQEIKTRIFNKDWHGAEGLIQVTRTTASQRLADQQEKYERLLQLIDAEYGNLAGITRDMQAEKDKILQQMKLRRYRIMAQRDAVLSKYDSELVRLGETEQSMLSERLAELKTRERAIAEKLGRLKAQLHEIQGLLEKLRGLADVETWQLFLNMSRNIRDNEQELAALTGELNAAIAKEQKEKQELTKACDEYSLVSTQLMNLNKTYQEKSAEESKMLRDKQAMYERLLRQVETDIDNISERLNQEKNLKQQELEQIKSSKAQFISETKKDGTVLAESDRLKAVIEEKRRTAQSRYKALLDNLVVDHNLPLSGEDTVVADMGELTKRVPMRCIPGCITCCRGCLTLSPWLTQNIILNGRDSIIHSYVPGVRGHWKSDFSISKRQQVAAENGRKYEIYILQENREDTDTPQLFGGARLQIYAVPLAEALDHENNEAKDNNIILKRHGLLSIQIDPDQSSRPGSPTLTVSLNPLFNDIFTGRTYTLPAPNGTSQQGSPLPILNNEPGTKGLEDDGYLPVFNHSTLALVARKYLDARDNATTQELIDGWDRKGRVSLPGSSVISWIRKEGNKYYYQGHREGHWRPMRASASFWSTGITFTDTSKGE